MDLYIQALLSGNARQRLDAVVALGDGGDPEVVGILAHALKDWDPNVRCAACRALARIGGEKAVPPLLHAGKHRDLNVRHAALSGLAALGDRRACPVFIRALRDSSPLIRAAAVAGLGALGDVYAVQHLWSALVDPDLMETATDAIIRIARRDGECIQLLHRSLPSFRSLYGAWNLSDSDPQLAAALDRIQAALPLRGLPIPAKLHPTVDLPRAAAAPDLPPDDLPIPE